MNDPATIKPLSVSELTSRLRGTLEPAFSNVWVQGEVSNARPAPSGHMYFSIKDAQSMMSVAIFGWASKKRTFELTDGLSVVLHGKLSIYPTRGTYQLVADHVEPLGAGALQLAFEQLKKKLQSEGLFDESRKRPLPAFPRKIVVLTSPTGAAIQDMLTILRRRGRPIDVVIIPALVQGEEAPKQLLAALDQAIRFKLGEVIVLARGGGSMEDLWAFNNEALARAVAASPIPTISAVGHEIDFTICDFVADRRAATPSAAAEILSNGWAQALDQWTEWKKRLALTMQRQIQSKLEILRLNRRSLVSPLDRLQEQMLRLDDTFSRLGRALKQLWTRKKDLLALQSSQLISPAEKLRQRAKALQELQDRKMRSMKILLQSKNTQLGNKSGVLDAISPLRVLSRGYSIVQKWSKPDVVRASDEVQKGDLIRVRLSKGEIRATVESVQVLD